MKLTIFKNGSTAKKFKEVDTQSYKFKPHPFNTFEFQQKVNKKGSSTWDTTGQKSLMKHVPVTRPFLPVLSTGWASSGSGTGVFLGLAATWLGDGVLSPLTASTQNVFCITELEGTWLSIPLEMSQADLGKNKRWFQVTISNMLNGYTTKLNATLNHTIETNKEMVVNSQLFISWCLQPR